ncbi:Oxaloacetate decarboxylase [Aquisphaera giovannonii]|uniref:Oxaloacetate decarboxylase n=1 Tax=Aquisphaera giovannonii TaxID=406548 RepID=A0A5B9VU35_9BACT|nr:isocitrate lyase/phosphoenolpyruvate mutase family protein [Aquisphaera giovannonii]QEH31883.1 Oxaloacetate decarboxylase [Aquisphaera giovannonii]
MPISVRQKRKAFAKLHEEGCFVLPNPWDLGSLRRLERLGFPAVATTSAGLAWSRGKEDYGITRDEAMEQLHTICPATDLPVNADFENGFADEPEAVARNVQYAAIEGVAGLSIEDWGPAGLYEKPLAAERIRAAREALDEDEDDRHVLLVGRCEAMLHGEARIGPVIERLTAYAEAGADCLYAPGVRQPDHIRAIVRAVAPKPVNVLLMGPEMKVADLAALGVRRVSVGGRLAAAAWKAFDDAARHLAELGCLPASIYGRG